VVRRGPHRGGGTGNVVYQFHDAMLELAYPIDPKEIASLGEIGFAERWRWRENGYSPLGVIVQIERADDSELPFGTWLYGPPFLPDSRWTIGQAPPQEPLYMIAPYDMEHQGVEEEPTITSVAIACPGVSEPSPIAGLLEATGICRIASGHIPAMELTFVGGARDSLDMRPELPLVLRNADD